MMSDRWRVKRMTDPRRDVVFRDDAPVGYLCKAPGGSHWICCAGSWQDGRSLRRDALAALKRHVEAGDAQEATPDV